MGNWCMIITLKIDINFSSDLYRIKYFSCIKQFSCINGITSLYNLPCYCNAVSPLWNSTVCMFMWLKHNDCGLFFLLFFLWSLCPLGLKSVVLYRLWHSVSSRCTFTIKELYVLPCCLVYTCYIQCTCVISIDT